MTNFVKSTQSRVRTNIAMSTLSRVSLPFYVLSRGDYYLQLPGTNHLYQACPWAHTWYRMVPYFQPVLSTGAGTGICVLLLRLSAGLGAVKHILVCTSYVRSIVLQTAPGRIGVVQLFFQVPNFWFRRTLLVFAYFLQILGNLPIQKSMQIIRSNFYAQNHIQTSFKK